MPTDLQEGKAQLRDLLRPKAGTIKFLRMVQILALQMPRKLGLNFC